MQIEDVRWGVGCVCVCVCVGGGGGGGGCGLWVWGWGLCVWGVCVCVCVCVGGGGGVMMGRLRPGISYTPLSLYEMQNRELKY